MKKMLGLLIILPLFANQIFWSCDNKEVQHRHIYIKNNSPKAIYYRFSFAYPDTTLKESDPNNYIVNPGEEKSTSASGFVYNPIMQMFIIDADVLKNEPWDSIVTNYDILKRYQFNEQDLENKQWIITYP